MNNCKEPQANTPQNVGCKEDLISKNIPALQISMRTSVLVLRALRCCENVKKETVFLCSFLEAQVIRRPKLSKVRAEVVKGLVSCGTELYLCETNLSAIDTRKPIHVVASTYIHTCV